MGVSTLNSREFVDTNIFHQVGGWGTKGIKHDDQNYGTCTSHAIAKMLEMVHGKEFSADFIYGNRNNLDNDGKISHSKGLAIPLTLERVHRDGCLTMDDCDALYRITGDSSFLQMKTDHGSYPNDFGAEPPYAEDIVAGYYNSAADKRRGTLCRSLPKSFPYRPLDYSDISDTISIATLKNALDRYSPVIICIDDNNFAYQSPYIMTRTTRSNNPNHTVCIFGYGTINGQDVFVGWNSWGDAFEDGGNFYIKADDAVLKAVIYEAYYCTFGYPGALPTFLREPDPGMGDYYCGYYGIVTGLFNEAVTEMLSGLDTSASLKINLGSTPGDVRLYKFAKENKYYFLADRVIKTNLSFKNLSDKDLINPSPNTAVSITYKGKTYYLKSPEYTDCGKAACIIPSSLLNTDMGNPELTDPYGICRNISADGQRCVAADIKNSNYDIISPTTIRKDIGWRPSFEAVSY